MLGCVFSLGFVAVVISLIYRAEKNIDELDKEWKALRSQAKNRTENMVDETFDDPGTSANEHEVEAVKDRRFTEYLQYRR
jgi:hypothetical protein